MPANHSHTHTSAAHFADIPSHSLCSGLDVVAVLRALGLGESALSGRLEAGGAVASTFVIAYAVHKCFAPVRISITLGATPFIVRYLRRRGILKAVAPPPPTPKP